MAVVWTDLVDPTRDELLSALPTSVDPDVIEELASAPGSPVRPLIEAHGAYALGVFLKPKAYPEQDRVDYLEIDMLAVRERLITVRKSSPHGDLVPVDALERRAATAHGSGELVHGIADGVADAFLDLLDDLYGEIDELEGHVEELEGTAVRKRLAELRHELLLARRTASATRAAVRRVVDGRVEISGPELFPPEVETQFVDTYETLVRVAEELDVARDLLSSVRDYLQAKITETQNDVGKKLTVIASLVLVPSFIVGFYGQNFSSAFDDSFWTLGSSVIAIVGSTIVQLALFRWRRWI